MSHSDQYRPHPRSQQESGPYKAFIPEFDIVAFDPLDPAKRYHVEIFIELNPTTQSGTMVHVTGDVIAASGYEEKEDECPAPSEYLHAYNAFGFVSKEDYHSGRISEILSGLPRPNKQQGINFWEVDPVASLFGLGLMGNGIRRGRKEGRSLSVMSGRISLLFLL
ncbi:uncharacterized protein BDV14DRAFT_167302 [Aspergillus stella-maris]|uniref:uncharacterized protein n=1 Tax=Aspergillus stella-maris TaxID=1810926 RepID=UPI003CCD5FD6